jgi:hypothetical protein
MKPHVWDMAGGAKAPAPARKPRRRSVAAILRAAYRRYAGDAMTRRAVRGCIH